MSNPSSSGTGATVLGGCIGAVVGGLFGAIMALVFRAQVTPEEERAARRTVQLILFTPAGIIFGAWLGATGLVSRSDKA